jgi:Flp pilus assembly protein TadD
MRTNRCNRIVFLTAAALLGAGGLAGCVGHGKHTGEHLARAQDRMSALKAGTEWDRAKQQFLAGDLDGALKTVDGSIDMNDSVAKSHALRGRILLEAGRLEQSIPSFRRALAIDPEHVDAHYFLGIVYERFRQHEEALSHYEQAARIDESDPQYVIAAAEMLIELDRLEDAEALLESRAGVFEHNAGVRQTYGHIAMLRGNAEKAVELFSEARLLAPDDISVVEDLAMAQLAAGEYAEAEFSLRRLLSDESYRLRRDLQHARARCLMELDRLVEARRLLIDLTSDQAGQSDLQAWIALGRVAVRLEDERRVRDAGRRLFAMAPNRPEGHILLALWKRGQGDLEGALEYARTAVERSKRDAAPALLLASLLTDLGRHEEARSAVTLAASIEPNNPMVRRYQTAVVPDDGQ